MPIKSPDLHGNAPDESPVALLVIDVLNDLGFAGGRQLLPRALAMADRIAELAAAARAGGVPVIYVNDNFGQWRSNRDQLIAHSRRPESVGAPMVEKLLPAADDYFVLKPKHSVFFATPLELLLEHLGARTLVLTGLTTESCILASAQDAYVRDFKVVIPEDAVAALDEPVGKDALAVMRKALKADTRPCRDWTFADLAS